MGGPPLSNAELQRHSKDPGAFLVGAAKCHDSAWLVWPSLRVALPAFQEGKGLLTIGGGKNTMTGPSDMKCDQLKKCMADNTPSAPERSATLHHIKMAAGIVGRGSHAGGSQRAPECAWVYAGSHNLSAAAWGKRDARTGDEEEEDFVCMSYEVGVLLIPPSPRPFALPWVSPAPRYDPTHVRPFSTNRYLNVLRGRVSAAWGGASTLQDIEVAAEDAQKQWQWLAARWAPGGTSTSAPQLPTLLKLQLGQIRKMVRVRVEAEAGVLAYDCAPAPGSETRKRSRHLKRSERIDELHSLVQHAANAPIAHGTELRVVRLADFSYGQGEAMESGDPIVTVYEAIGGGSWSGGRSGDARRRFVHDFDDRSRSCKPSLKVVDRDGPRGVLLAFLGDSDNGALLQVMALAREEVERACWGVLCLQPNELAGTIGQHEDGRWPPDTPTHADLLALEFGIDPACELPALVLVTADLATRQLVCKGAEALGELATTSRLQDALRKLATDSDDAIQEPPTSWWKRQQMGRVSRAAGAAAWVRSKEFKLLLIEPEGVLKKQCNVSIVPDAMQALTKRRSSLWGAARLDAFYAACVPFLRALLLELPESEPDETGEAGETEEHGRRRPVDGYDPFSQYGNGPPRGELRNDSPRIALVSNIGHLVSKERPGEAALVSEESVRETLARLVRRIASELGVDEPLLRTRLAVYISFRAPGTSALPTASCADEWSEAWSKPQPGMLTAAMEEVGVPATETLMVGFDFCDQEAASNAGVHYVNQAHLLGVERFDEGFDGEHIDTEHYLSSDHVAPVRATAPRSFAAEKRSAQASRPLPRSPAKVRA